jgi:hypothetical protein
MTMKIKVFSDEEEETDEEEERTRDKAGTSNF